MVTTILVTRDCPLDADNVKESALPVVLGNCHFECRRGLVAGVESSNDVSNIIHQEILNIIEHAKRGQPDRPSPSLPSAKRIIS